MNTTDKDFFTNLTESCKIGFLLWKVNNFWQREFKRSLKQYDLTHSQLLLLLGIFKGESKSIFVTQKYLSNKAGIDPMTTSTVLRTLQKRGYIERQPNTKDTRTNLISLTDNGKDIIYKSMDILKVFNDDFFRPLNDYDKEFKNNLLTLLKEDENSKDEIPNIIK